MHAWFIFFIYVAKLLLGVVVSDRQPTIMTGMMQNNLRVVLNFEIIKFIIF